MRKNRARETDLEVLELTRHLPAALDRLAEQAKQGDPVACRLFLQAMGLLPGRTTTIVHKLTFYHPTRGKKSKDIRGEGRG